MGQPATRRSWVTAYVVLPLLFAAAVASLLPLIETNVWWIRYLDYLRLQLAAALAALLLIHLVLRPSGGLGWAGLLIAVLGLGYNMYRISPYMRLVGDKSLTVSSCPAGSGLRIMVANVQKKNENAPAFLNLARQARPDIILAMETDAFWDQQLTELNQSYPYRVQHIPEQHAYYGMHLLSKYELVSPQIKLLFDTFTPTVFSGVRLPDGSTVQLVGVHPRPPQSWSQPTTMRDAHLLAAGLEARESDAPTIVAGDLNATPWERVTRRTMRIGGLIDPRVGRGYYPTYVLKTFLFSWPLDQVLFENSFALQAFRVLPGVGSDHYPLMADLCHMSAAAAQQKPPDLENDDLQEAQTSIEAARTLESAK